MDSFAKPDPSRCPECASQIVIGDARCVSCGLMLVGAVAAEVWRLDNELATLAAHREELMQLLRVGDGGAVPPPVPPLAVPATASRAVPPSRGPASTARPGPVTTQVRTAQAATAATTTPPRAPERPVYRADPPPKPRAEWTTQRVQNLLLTIGALLVLVAAVIFAAVAFGRIGTAGRSAIMLAITAAAGVAARVAQRRGLSSTAEAVATIFALLCAVDVYAARRLGLAALDTVDSSTYWACASAAVAVVCGTYRVLVPVRSALLVCLGAAQLPAFIALLGSDRDVFPLATAVVAGGQSLVMVLVEDRLRGRDVGREPKIFALASPVATWVASSLAVMAYAVGDAGNHLDEGATVSEHVAALIVCTAAAAAAAWMWRSRPALRSAATVGAVVVAQAPLLVALIARSDVTGSLLAGTVGAQVVALLGAHRWLRRTDDDVSASVAAASAGGWWTGAACLLAGAGIGDPGSSALLGSTSHLVVGLAVITGVAVAAAFAWRDLPAHRSVATTAAVVCGQLPLVVLLLSRPHLSAFALAVALGAQVTALVAVDRALARLGEQAGAAVASASAALSWMVAVALVALVGLAAPESWPGGLSGTTVGTCGALAVLTAVAAAAAVLWRADPMRLDLTAAAAVVVGQLVLVAALHRESAGVLVVGIALSAQVVGLVVVGPYLTRWGAAVARGASVVSAYATWLVALALVAPGGFGAAYSGELAAASIRDHVLGLVALAAAATAAALVWRGTELLRDTAAAGATLALVVAAMVGAHDGLEPVQIPGAIAAAGLLAVIGGASLPRAWRRGPTTTGALTLVLSVILVSVDAMVAVLGPLGWIAEPWTIAGDEAARAVVSPYGEWHGTVVTLVVIAVAAAGAAFVGEIADQRHRAAGVVTALAGTAVLLVPVGARLKYGSGVLWVVGAGLVVVGVSALQTREHASALGDLGGAVGCAVSSIGLAWALADEQMTLLVLAMLVGSAVTVAVVHPRWRLAASCSGAVLTAAWTFAVTRSADLPYDRTGFVLAAVGCAGIGVGALVALRWGHALEGAAVEAIGAAAAVTGLLLSATDPGWVSWTLALTGVTALADAVRAERRQLAWVGGALLTGCSWVRLYVEHVREPEAYAAPLAAVSLALGHLRRRKDPGCSSWSAYGGGLGLAFGPSLYVALSEDAVLRPVLLCTAALVVVLLGARERLQAPLTIGAFTLAANAVAQVAPYADTVPRWVSIGTAGITVLAVGATYEKRLQDVQRWRDQYDALT